MSLRKPTLLLLIIAILWGGFAIRVWQLETEAIWHDEGWSIRAIRGPFTTPDDNTPVLYYLSGHILWKMGTGETPFAFRFLSVLLGLLTIAVGIRLGGQWYGGFGAATAGILIASSPLLWEYAQEVRAYVAVPLIALILIGLAEAILNYPNERPVPTHLWIALFFTELIGLYTHNLVVPAIVWLNVAVGVVWGLRWDRPKLLRWAGVHILLILCYLPWLSTQSPSGTPLNTVPEWGFDLVQDIWYSYFLPALTQVQATDSDIWLNLAGVALIFSSLFLIVQRRSTRTWILLSHALLIPLFSTFLLQRAHIDFHPRYYIAAVPGTLLIFAAVINRQALAVGAVAIGSIFITYNSLDAIANNPTYQHDDFAALAEYYAELPPGAVIIVPFGREPALQDYYAEAQNIHARFINIPLHSGEEVVLERLSQLQGRHVEFLTWFQLPADIRGMYPCLLAASSDASVVRWKTFGLQTEGYEVVKTPDFQPLDAQPAYQEVTFNGAGWMATRQAICVRTKWQLANEIDDPLSVSMRLLSPFDEDLARHDAVIRDREQVSSDEWDEGQRGDSYHLLQLPPGTPNADYSVAFEIYSPSQPSGLDIVINNRILGKTFYPNTTLRITGPPLTNPPQEHQLISGPAQLINGATVDITVLLAYEVDQISLRGDGWSVEQPVEWQGEPHWSWHRFRIPPEADNNAQLIIGDDDILTTFSVNHTERLFEPPPFDIAVEMSFTDIGKLIGVRIPYMTVSPTNPPVVELIWQATAPTTVSYIVFAQLLDENGRLIAQSDQQPADNQRPTTGWVAEEYIVDNHQLSFQVEPYEGPAYFIVGFYDARTGDRVLTVEGNDHVRLPVDITSEALP